MTDERPLKRIRDSRFTLSALMGPQDTNPYGNVHGGVIMKLADEAGALVAMRHANKPVVTVAVDSLAFIEPIRVGNLVQCHAELTYVGRSSLEVHVEVVAEDPLRATSKVASTAYFVYVALDETGCPTPVAGVLYETPEERLVAEQAQARQAYRKQQRAKEQR